MCKNRQTIITARRNLAAELTGKAVRTIREVAYHGDGNYDLLAFFVEVTGDGAYIYDVGRRGNISESRHYTAETYCGMGIGAIKRHIGLPCIAVH